MAVVLILILIAELFFSYGALRKLIDRQTASFFRLVQQEDDFDREMKSYKKTTKKDWNDIFIKYYYDPGTIIIIISLL